MLLRQRDAEEHLQVHHGCKGHFRQCVQGHNAGGVTAMYSVGFGYSLKSVKFHSIYLFCKARDLVGYCLTLRILLVIKNIGMVEV